MRIIQRELHAQLRAEVLQARDRITAIVRPLNAAQLNEHPEPKGWSIAEVIEHLLVADERSSAPAKEVIHTARPDAGAPAREWKPSFLGGLIASSLEKKRPLKAPRVFLPGPTARGGAVEALFARETEFVAAMDSAASLDWRALRVRSGALPPWAPKMNLGDGFRIHAVHLKRHALQIERLAGKLP
ncbi:MAG: DinB family protein [Gemmatimonadota bacterium]|nr:DinB family protein [Gemmatimonadota bacterium]